MKKLKHSKQMLLDAQAFLKNIETNYSKLNKEYAKNILKLLEKISIGEKLDLEMLKAKYLNEEEPVIITNNITNNITIFSNITDDISEDVSEDVSSLVITEDASSEISEEVITNEEAKINILCHVCVCIYFSIIHNLQNKTNQLF